MKSVTVKNEAGPECRIRSDFLPLSRPSIGEAEIEEVVSTLRSGWITTGPKVGRFEKKFKDYLGVQESVAVSSGTAGLHLALLAAGIGPGDEVITSTMTFAATVNTIVLCGAKPVLVDCERGTLNLDIKGVEAKIGEKTRAIVPVHFAGQSCPMDELLEIARKYRLFVIEDAAHALGTEYKGRKIGTIGDATVFSFHPIKAITTGEGGMIVTPQGEWADKMRLLRFHGVTTSAWARQSGEPTPYAIELPGFKYTMMDIQAALGIRQMDRLESFIERRTALASLYNHAFREIDGATPLSPVPYPHVHSWHLFVIKLELERLNIDRERFLKELKARNIGAGIHFPAVHLQPYYQRRYGYKVGDFPVAEQASERILSLPLFPEMVERDVRDVVGALSEILAAHRR